MALYYFDASALVKYYVTEPGSTWVRQMSTDDFATAAHLTQQHPLKAYDPIQLATALRSQRLLADHQLAFTFVTGDTPLIAAAQAEELLTDNPFDHLSPSDIPGRSG